ncbi:MAG: SDR family NAD(P)-dependent oxidoreductase, partial [Colwellia sp.]|nr:SDR family NAD(P)-dependent oxidoreductase [Colwellia sp.]
MKKTFSDFQIGDIAVFEQSFSPKDFIAFSQLSGDQNPLHHDANYAAASAFEQTIVPVHMTLAPLSRIAGMIFPGDPSLYLGHEVRSILPVFYGQTLSYSAKIIALNAELRALTIRVLVIRGAEVVLEAEMRVMSRLESWECAEPSLCLAPSPAVSLVTGATGEIGTALAVVLARRGQNLVLVDRGPGKKRDALAQALKQAGGREVQIDFVTADLNVPQQVSELSAYLTARGDVACVFHSASPPLDAPLQNLVQVNYAALQQMSEAVLPAMLLRQQGVLAHIGSVATERVIPNWHNYSAAKAMAGQFLTGFDKSHSEYGARGLSILSGLVATEYSASVQGSAPAMLPQELAEAVVEVALDDRAGRAMMIEWNTRRAGSLGFHHNPPAPAPVAVAQAQSVTPAGGTPELASTEA